MKPSVQKLAARIAADPSASYFLKDAVKVCLNRDPLDALRDAETLVAILSDNADVKPASVNDDLLKALVSAEGLIYEAQSDIPEEYRAKRDCNAALKIIRAAIAKATNPTN